MRNEKKSEEEEEEGVTASFEGNLGEEEEVLFCGIKEYEKGIKRTGRGGTRINQIDSRVFLVNFKY